MIRAIVFALVLAAAIRPTGRPPRHAADPTSSWPPTPASHHARALGLRVDLVVGDLDSVDAADLEAAVADGTEVERHPTAKDATDLELALDAAVARGATRVLVVGAHGGRLDHFLANVLLLASPRFAAVRVEARLAGAQVIVVRDRAELQARPGRSARCCPSAAPPPACAPTGSATRCATRRSNPARPAA